MYLSRWKRKALEVGVALAAAAALAAAMAGLDRLFPHGTAAAFAGKVLLLGLLIAAVLAGFAAACDGCESLLGRRRDRILGAAMAKPGTPAWHRARGNPTHADYQYVPLVDPAPDSRLPQPARSNSASARGTTAPTNRLSQRWQTAPKRWMGQ
jgi:hypothetical protein